MMTPNSTDYTYDFIGREDALNAFHQLRTLRAQKNVLYIKAGGGWGKSRLLHEYIKQCGQQWHPWHVRPADSAVEIIIDFYDFQNRSVTGLRESIIERIGWEHFPRFSQKYKELATAGDDLKGSDAGQQARVLALRLEVEYLFFQEFSRALRALKRYAVLFFDTFEIVYNRRVGRWLLEEFLTNPATNGCFIVLAGRPRPFNLPPNAVEHALKPFTPKEAADYFRKKWENQAGEAGEAVIQASGGEPLLLDLLVYYASVLEGSIKELAGKSRLELEKAIITPFLSIDPLNEVIQEMAYLKGRFNQAIYDRRQPISYTAQLDYDDLGERLKALPFVKHYPGDDSYSLHDKFRDMLVDHGGGDWRELANELYEDIVQDWYEEAIEAATNKTERDVLRTEQLTYRLERPGPQGILQYQAYFAEIKKTLDFDFNDLLWGEVAEHLPTSQEGYVLAREQGAWLYSQSRYTDAVPAYEHAIIHPTAEQDPDFFTNTIARLGHCYWRLGNLQKAHELWQEKLTISRQRKDVRSQAYMEFNLGQLLPRLGDWRESRQLLEAAMEHGQRAADAELLVLVLFSNARLLAQEGKYDEAVAGVDRGLKLIERINPGSRRHAEVLLDAGDIHRYADRYDTAKGYYHQANRTLSTLTGWPDLRAQILAGLGAASYLAGNRRRTRKSRPLEDYVADQQVAFDYLNDALIAVRDSNLETHLAMILDRLADIYFELHELETGPDKDSPKVASLRQKLDGLSLPEETIWKRELREPEYAFVSLNTLGKTQRLLEVAYLQAEKVFAPHQVLDSLVNTVRAAQRRERKADIDYYSTLVDSLRGLDAPSQEVIFMDLLDLFRAHLEFSDDPENAIDIYQVVLPRLIQLPGFGRLQATTELPEIERRLLLLDLPIAAAHCQRLAKAWANQAELLAFIYGVSDNLII